MEETIRKYRWWLVGTILLGMVVWAYQRWRDYQESRQDKVILAAAAHFGVPPALVKAVVWQESRFDPRAHGQKGEIGLMQIGPLAAQEWAENEKVAFFRLGQLYDPEKNTLAGTWYLRKLLKRYGQVDDPMPYALADYNAGRSHVLRWKKGDAETHSQAFIEQIDFPSTKKYVQSVMKRYRYYERIFPKKT